MSNNTKELSNTHSGRLHNDRAYTPASISASLSMLFSRQHLTDEMGRVLLHALTGKLPEYEHEAGYIAATKEVADSIIDSFGDATQAEINAGVAHLLALLDEAGLDALLEAMDKRGSTDENSTVH